MTNLRRFCSGCFLEERRNTLYNNQVRCRAGRVPIRRVIALLGNWRTAGIKACKHHPAYQLWDLQPNVRKVFGPFGKLKAT